MTRKPIDEYLPPDKRQNTSRIQGWVSPELVRAINYIRKQRRIQWSDVINAALQRFAEDYYQKLKQEQADGEKEMAHVTQRIHRGSEEGLHGQVPEFGPDPY
jgi:hypothetical protein